MKILLSVLLALAISQVSAQSLSVNTDGSTAHPSSLFDVKSTTKGILIPRMASADRTAIAAPAIGLLVYDTDSLAFSYFTGGGWAFIKADADVSKSWSVNGNSVANTDFIGTINNNSLKFKTFNENAGFLDSTSQGTSLGFRSLNNNTGLRNTAFGFNSLSSLTTANSQSNTAIGNAALASATNSERNTAVGDSALALNIGGFANTAVGAFAAKKTILAGNTAIGRSALENNTTGQTNTAIGYFPLYNNISGDFNVAIGESPAYNNKTGNTNIAIGNRSLYFDTSGYSNIAIGSRALYFNRNKNNLVAIGDSALYSNGFGGTGTEGSKNTAVGSKAMYSNTIGSQNTAIGNLAINRNISGESNVALGNKSLLSILYSSNNIAIGDSALGNISAADFNNFPAGTVVVSSTSVLAPALVVPYSNNAIGKNALATNGAGGSNVAIGNNALAANTSGTYSVALGYDALNKNINGHVNTAVGYQASFNNLVGQANVALGKNALFTNTVGNRSTAIGTHSLFSSTGSFNTALGTLSGSTITSGSENTLIGYSANVSSGVLFNATSIGSNSYVSSNNSLVLGSINGVNNATADTKVGIGVNDPSEKLEIGNGRLRFRGFPGAGSAHGITWTNNAGTTDRAFIGMENDDFIGIYNFGFGAWNVRVHNSSGEVGINKQPLLTSNDSRLQVKQTGIQNGIGIEAAANTNHWDWFVTNTANSDLQLYYNGVLKGTYGNAGGVYTPSDRRLKKDISLLPTFISQINKLDAYKYHYLDNNNADAFSYGFMAQDVQRLFPDAVKETEIKNGETRLGINYQYFTVLAIKGIQEQQKQIDDLKTTNENLQKQIDEIKRTIRK